MKKIKTGFIILCLLLIQTAYALSQDIVHSSSNPPHTVWIVTDSDHPTDLHDLIPAEWIRYLSGVEPVFKSFSSVSTNINDYSNVDLIFCQGLGGYSLSSGQLLTLKQYVQGGGSLFVGSRTDVLVSSWYGIGGGGQATPYGFKFPKNNALDLSEIFGNYSVPSGVFSLFKQWGYFNYLQLPATIVPVVLNNTGKAEPLVFAGTEGLGKVVLMPNDWMWCYAMGYPSFHSPILLRLIDFLLPNYLKESPRTMRADRQYVAFRVDDIFAYSLNRIVATDRAFKAYNVTQVTFGVFPHYSATTSLLNELATMQGREIAMHGDSSGHTDPAKYTYSTAYSRLSAGIRAVQGNFSVRPKIYLCPYNSVANLDVQRALKDLDLVWSSDISQYFNYTFNYLPGGCVDESTMLSWDISDEDSFWKNLVWFEHCRLLDGIPYMSLIHPWTDTTYLERFLYYLRNYRDVQFVTMSECLNKSYRTVPLANLLAGEEGAVSFVDQYEWTYDEYAADVRLSFIETGTCYIKFNNTIISATIDGTPHSDYEANMLKLPILSSNQIHTIHVDFGIPPPKPPKAIFTYNPSDPEAYEDIFFNASQSYDPDGFITDYFWDFGDGENETGVTTTHYYELSSTYTVTLLVTDSQNLTNMKTLDISVSPLPPPIIAIAPSTVGIPGEPLFFQNNITIINYGPTTTFTLTGVNFSGTHADDASVMTNLPKSLEVTTQGYMILLVRVDIPENAELGTSSTLAVQATIESNQGTTTATTILTIEIAKELT